MHRGNVHVDSGVAGALLSVRFDVIDSAIVAVPFYPTALIEANVVHRLSVADVRDLDGQSLAEPYVARFHTGTAVPPREMPRAVSWAEVAPVLRDGCGGRACHGSDGPAAGLVLDTPEGVRTTAIGVLSRQLPTSSGEGTRVEIGLGGSYIIDVVAGVGRPATSYLMYKLLDDPHIVGEVMPPRPGAPLDQASVRLIDDWILSGAPTD